MGMNRPEFEPQPWGPGPQKSNSVAWASVRAIPGTCGDENRRALVATKLSNGALACKYGVSMSMANTRAVKSRWGITQSSLRAPKPSSRHCFDEGYGARSRECLIFEELFFAHIVRICITNDTSKAGFVKLEAIASFSGEFASHPLLHSTCQAMGRLCSTEEC